MSIVTIHRRTWSIEHPDVAFSYDVAEFLFTPRPAEEWTNPRSGCLHRRTVTEPIDVEVPALSILKQGRLSVHWDREEGWPAEMVYNAAMGERSGFAMAKKAPKGPGLFDQIDEPDPVMARHNARELGASCRGQVGIGPCVVGRSESIVPLPVPIVSRMDPVVPPTDPEERLSILAAAVVRAIAQLYAEDRPAARAILCVGLEDAGIKEDETR
jgi:hypothetical protein